MRKYLMTIPVLTLLLAACSSAPVSPNASVSPSASVSSPSATSSSSLSPQATPSGGTLTVAVLGDWGEGSSAQHAIAERMCAVRRQTPFSYVVTVGDNFRPSGTATAKNYWDPEACLLKPPAVQWKAAWGNHDLGDTSTASVLGATSRTYLWSTPQADFFILDSNRAGDLAQRDWLAARLAASRAPVKIAVFHHPAYAGGSYYVGDVDVQRMWVPLFERYGVNLVLSGHAHDYQHARVRGIDYVVTGGGGAPLYACTGHESWLLRCDAVYEFLLVTIHGTSVSVTALEASGKQLDHFTVG